MEHTLTLTETLPQSSPLTVIGRALCAVAGIALIVAAAFVAGI
jgi:hypothetical protein